MLDEGENSKNGAKLKYSIKKMPASGLGVIATANITAGDIIITEKPILVIPAEVKGDQYSWWVHLFFWL